MPANINKKSQEADLDEIFQFTVTELTKLCGIKVEANTSLLKTGILDSLGLVELIMSVQNKYSIIVDIGDLKNDTFDTPQLMSEYFYDNRERK